MSETADGVGPQTWVVRHDDGFASAEWEIEVGNTEAHELFSGTCYPITVLDTRSEARKLISELGFDCWPFGSQADVYGWVKFMVWLECQDLFSREWYFGQIHLHYVMAEYVKWVFSNQSETEPNIGLDDVTEEYLRVGALCREYEMSAAHKKSVIIRTKQMVGWRSSHAAASRNAANGERREEAEEWKKIAREVAKTSSLKGGARDAAIARALRTAGFDPAPKPRTIREAIKGVKKLPG